MLASCIVLFNLTLQHAGLDIITCRIEIGCSRLPLLQCCYAWRSSIMLSKPGRETHWVLSLFGWAIKQAADTPTTNTFHIVIASEQQRRLDTMANVWGAPMSSTLHVHTTTQWLPSHIHTLAWTHTSFLSTSTHLPILCTHVHVHKHAWT